MDSYIIRIPISFSGGAFFFVRTKIPEIVVLTPERISFRIHPMWRSHSFDDEIKNQFFLIHPNNEFFLNNFLIFR